MMCWEWRGGPSIGFWSVNPGPAGREGTQWLTLTTPLKPGVSRPAGVAVALATHRSMWRRRPSVVRGERPPSPLPHSQQLRKNELRGNGDRVPRAGRFPRSFRTLCSPSAAATSIRRQSIRSCHQRRHQRPRGSRGASAWGVLLNPASNHLPQLPLESTSSLAIPGSVGGW